MKYLSQQLLKAILPDRIRLPARYARKKLTGTLDPEMLYVSHLLDNNARFVDIGANVGIYSYHFSKTFQNIEAFEPLAEISFRLESLNCKGIKIHNVALSNSSGVLPFYIPIVNGKTDAALASIEERTGSVEVRNVDVKRLDDYNFQDVGLIKIDAEGHEESVMLGGIDTIKRNMPIMIIEIEQRHSSKPIASVFKIATDLGYQVFFLKQKTLRPLSDFSYEADQAPYIGDELNKDYVNNFIFLPQKTP